MGSIDFTGLIYLGIAIGVVLALALVGGGWWLTNHISVVIR